jgi:hypothetical protein
MAGGWFKLYRKLMESERWLREPFTVGQAWVDLLAMAAYEPTEKTIRGIQVACDRGQIVTSARELGERWKWGRGATERFLNGLQNEQQIEQQKNNLSTVITVVNYEWYQGDGPQIEPQNETQNEPQNGPQKAPSPLRIPLPEKKETKKKDPPLPPPPLPPSCQTTELESTVAEWLAYKAERGERYKSRGIKALYTKIANVAAMHGPGEVERRMQAAMAANYQGWNFPENGANKSGRSRDIGPGQRHDSAAAEGAPVVGW